MPEPKPFTPTSRELGTAIRIQQSLDPSPQIQFVEEDAEGPFSWAWREFQITNPITGKGMNFDAAATCYYPQITLNDCVSYLGFKILPPVPPTPVSTPLPNTGMPPLKPGQIMTPFGPSGA